MKRLRLTFWDLHPEVTAFVASHLAVVPQVEIRRRIAERFGADKTPSLSALGRFACEWKTVNQAKIRERRRARFKPQEPTK